MCTPNSEPSCMYNRKINAPTVPCNYFVLEAWDAAVDTYSGLAHKARNETHDTFFFTQTRKHPSFVREFLAAMACHVMSCHVMSCQPGKLQFHT